MRDPDVTASLMYLKLDSSNYPSYDYYMNRTTQATLYNLNYIQPNEVRDICETCYGEPA